MTPFLLKLQALTEAVLTWRARRRWKQKERQRRKHWLVDWIESFLWAAGVVLLVNQFAFQAYEIPSGSMKDTLLIGDRIFVNKFIYGPELLPGWAKLPGFTEPVRGDVIIFENPTYLSKGPLFDLAQRLLYMLTLTLVDLDRDPATGETKIHFLIKRAVAVDGDQIRQVNDGFEIQPRGLNRWLSEADLKAAWGLNYQEKRLFAPGHEALLQSAARAWLAEQTGRAPLPAEAQAWTEFQNLPRREGPVTHNFDAFRAAQAQAVAALMPWNAQAEREALRWELGHYVPVGMALPVGDNRDNSQDGRFFGPVRRDRILGQAALKYWPLGRLGGIE